jgi:hypothetical protein
MLENRTVAAGGVEHSCVCGVRGLRCQPRDVVTEKIPTDS